MVGNDPSDVAREPEKPTIDEVFGAMEPCKPYTVADLASEFAGVSRWTIQRRLDQLTEEGKIEKKKHAETRVTYWFDTEDG